MFKLIIIIALVNGSGSSIASSQGGYSFSSLEKCQAAARTITKYEAKVRESHREVYCLEE